MSTCGIWREEAGQTCLAGLWCLLSAWLAKHGAMPPAS